MGLFDFLKKKKRLSPKSANFARLVKSFCMDSGIPIQLQINITKAIAKDFINVKNKNISNFIFMDPVAAKAYLKRYGMNDLDTEIFWSIIQTNRDSFLVI